MVLEQEVNKYRNKNKTGKFNTHIDRCRIEIDKEKSNQYYLNVKDERVSTRCGFSPEMK